MRYHLEMECLSTIGAYRLLGQIRSIINKNEEVKIEDTFWVRVLTSDIGDFLKRYYDAGLKYKVCVQPLVN